MREAAGMDNGKALRCGQMGLFIEQKEGQCGWTNLVKGGAL